ncbi:MAG: hypothetical protein WCE73_17845, partial [Candidatus Angelobacter sp.]
VCIGLSTSNLVMEVGHGEHDAKFLPQVRQDAEKGHGVGAAGTRDRNSRSGVEQLLFADIFEDFFQH